MEPEAYARSVRDTRHALIHIAYGPPLTFNWHDAFRFACRDIVREWRCDSPSSYGAPFVREIRRRQTSIACYEIPSFHAGWIMCWYLLPAAFAADCGIRLVKIIRHASVFNAGVQVTRRSARAKIEAAITKDVE